MIQSASDKNQLKPNGEGETFITNLSETVGKEKEGRKEGGRKGWSTSHEYQRLVQKGSKEEKMKKVWNEN